VFVVCVQFICSYVLFPLALFMGVHLADCRKVAGLIGTKTFLSEFIAYLQLSQLIGNRKALKGHMANNGTWHWSGDDVVLTSVGLEDTVLTNGVISVQYMQPLCQLRYYTGAWLVNFYPVQTFSKLPALSSTPCWDG